MTQPGPSTMSYPYPPAAQPAPAPPQPSIRRRVLVAVALAALVLFIFSLLTSGLSSAPPDADLPLSEFHALLAADEIESVTVEGDALFCALRSARQTSAPSPVRRFRTRLPPETSRQWAFVQWLLENRRGAAVRVENNQNLLLNILIPLIPWVVIFGFLWLFVFRRLRNAPSGPLMWAPVYPMPPQGAPAPSSAAVAPPPPPPADQPPEVR